jgi:hypothetical protein
MIGNLIVVSKLPINVPSWKIILQGNILLMSLPQMLVPL